VCLLNERKEKTMNTLIIYDSNFGNTAQLAQTMADKQGEHGTARIASANEADLTEVKEIDLLLVGGPTQRHGLSPSMKTLLEGFPRRTLQRIHAGAFDTRYHMSAWKSGSAAHGIASKLKRAGASLIVEPESFFVAEREGPLEEGELERAAIWAEEIYQKFEADRSIQRNNAEVS
jgi:flavodoxin